MKLYISYILLFLFFAEFTFAQNLLQITSDTVKLNEEIEVTGFYDGISTSNAPSSVYIFRKDKLIFGNAKNAGEILSHLPGVFIKSYGNSSLQTISINGLGAEQTVILLNGVKLNSSQNGQYDLSLINSDAVSKIELMQNGYSTVYGSDAISGVVNIVMEDSETSSEFVKLISELGSYNSKKLSLSNSINFSDLNLSWFISNSSSDNNYNYYFDNGVEKEMKTREYSKYNISDYSVSGAYKIKNLKLNINSSFTNSNREIPSIETGNSPVKTTQLDRNWTNYLNLAYSYNNFKFSSEFSFLNHLMNYNTAPLINDFYKNISFSSVNKFKLTYDNFENTSGLELKNSSLESDKLKPDIKRNNYAFFNSSEISLSSLKLFPSFRYEYISDLKKSVWIYKTGFNFRPFKSVNFNLRGNIGNNFSAPNFNALYWRQGGNPNLKPETSVNFELGSVFSGNYIFDYTLNLSYLKINFTDRIIWIPQRNFIWSPFNIGESVSDVFNLGIELKSNLYKDFNTNATFYFTSNNSVKKNSSNPNDQTNGKQLIYIPEIQIKSMLGFNFKSLGVNFIFSHLGRRFSDQENLISLAPVNILDANLSYSVNIFSVISEFTFSVNNLSNTDYSIISGYPMPLRNFNFQLNLKYKY